MRSVQFGVKGIGEFSPGGIVAVVGSEIHEHIWVTPDDAMRRRDAGEIELAPPTFVTLHTLSRSADVDSALARAAEGPVEFFSTRVMKSGAGDLFAVWHGDVAYEGGDLDLEGARHRLAIGGGSWRYDRT